MRLPLMKLFIGASSVFLLTSCSKSSGSSSSIVDTSSKTTTIKYIDTLAPSVAMTHPGGLVNADDITRIKANLTIDPWKSGWAKLIANSHAQSTYVASPTVKLIRGGSSVEEADPDNYSHAMNDVAAAFQLGIRWKVSGDTTYARTAVNILNAWATTCVKLSGDPNVSLASGIYGYEFAAAGELLRDFSGWSASDFKKYQNWMLAVFYPVVNNFLTTHGNCNPLHTWSNWDLCNLASLMAMGILTDQRVLYNYAINYVQRGNGNGNIFRTINPIYDSLGLAQMQESGRDQGHCTLSLQLLSTICQLAWNQGDDLWGFNNNMVLKASEYVAKYNIAYLDVPFTTAYWQADCNGTVDTLKIISSDSRGTIRPMWSLIYYHYANISKLSAPYTLMGVNRTFPEGGGGDYGSDSGGFDQLGFGTLLYAR